MTKWDLFLEPKDGSRFENLCVTCHINILKEKNHIIISIDIEKEFHKIQHLIMTKHLTNYKQRENTTT